MFQQDNLLKQLLLLHIPNVIGEHENKLIE